MFAGGLAPKKVVGSGAAPAVIRAVGSTWRTLYCGYQAPQTGFSQGALLCKVSEAHRATCLVHKHAADADPPMQQGPIRIPVKIGNRLSYSIPNPQPPLQLRWGRRRRKHVAQGAKPAEIKHDVVPCGREAVAHHVQHVLVLQAHQQAHPALKAGRLRRGVHVHHFHSDLPGVPQHTPIHQPPVPFP